MSPEERADVVVMLMNGTYTNRQDYLDSLHRNVKNAITAAQEELRQACIDATNEWGRENGFVAVTNAVAKLIRMV